jgi:hypothetical protein
MEQFCSSTRRYQEALKRDDDDDFEWTEVQLAVPVEDFLAYRWDWKDLQAFLTGGIKPKLLWITESAFLIVDLDGDMYRFAGRRGYMAASIEETAGMTYPNEREHALTLVQMYQSDPLTVELSVFWRAVATSNSVELEILDELKSGVLGLPSGPLLSQFLRESPLLRTLEFDGFPFWEEHCLALTTLQRTDLNVTLTNCNFYPQQVEEVFYEWFQHNKVVTEINCFESDSRTLSALSGNNSVRTLKLNNSFSEGGMRCLHQGLTGNRGIEDLIMVDVELTDKNWCLLLHSLSTHPRIECVTYEDEEMSLSAESKTTWMNAILQMLQHNTVVRTLDLSEAFGNEDVYQNSILPRLDMNRNYFEVQRKAVKRADPSIRSQLLGRALHVVRYNPNLVFQFLSENVPAFVRSEEEEDSTLSLQKEGATITSGQKRKAP